MNNVLVIADDHLLNKYLIQLLFKYFNDDNIVFTEFTSNYQIIATPLHIETKYYSCQITLHSMEFSFLNDQNQSEQFFKQNKFDGVLFMIDGNNLNGFIQYIENCDFILNLLQPSLQAVIYQKKEGTVIKTEIIEAEEKKIESYVEAIFVDLNSEFTQKQTKKLAEQVEETTGFLRIVEIFECNTWCQMVPKAQKEQGIKQQKQQITDQEKLEYEDEQFAKLIQDMTKIRNSQMTDDQRREQASNLMNQLLNLCGEDDEDEDV